MNDTIIQSAKIAADAYKYGVFWGNVCDCAAILGLMVMIVGLAWALVFLAVKLK